MRFGVCLASWICRFVSCKMLQKFLDIISLNTFFSSILFYPLFLKLCNMNSRSLVTFSLISEPLFFSFLFFFFLFCTFGNFSYLSSNLPVLFSALFQQQLSSYIVFFILFIVFQFYNFHLVLLYLLFFWDTLFFCWDFLIFFTFQMCS